MFFRNTWSWPKDLPENMPNMHQEADGVIQAWHDTFGATRLYCTPSPAPAAPAKGGVVLVDGPSVVPDLLFTENETNFEVSVCTQKPNQMQVLRLISQRLYNGKNRTPFVKDAFHDHIIPGHRPPEPEPEKSVTAGLETKKKGPGSPRTPKLPPHHTAAQLDDDEEEEAGDEKAAGENGENGENGTEAAADANGVDSEYVVTPPPRPVSAGGHRHFVNPEKKGTKAGAHYVFKDVPPKGGCVVVRLKMTPNSPAQDPSILDEELFDDNIDERRVDADEFYGKICRGSVSDDLQNIMRQALSGMLW